MMVVKDGWCEALLEIGCDAQCYPEEKPKLESAKMHAIQSRASPDLSLGQGNLGKKERPLGRQQIKPPSHSKWQERRSGMGGRLICSCAIHPSLNFDGQQLSDGTMVQADR